MTDKQPEALRLADELMEAHKGHSDEGSSTFSESAALLRRLGPMSAKQAEQIKAITHLVTQLHQAKGRYHTQNALCALFDAFGLENTKPEKR